MGPRTRSHTKKIAAAESRDIVSWASAVTSETIFYERFHEYDKDGEVLFVQLRMNEQGELVPWTKDEEDEDQELEMSDDDSAEEGEVDPDFVPEVIWAADEDHGATPGNAQETSTRRRAPTKHRQIVKVNENTRHIDECPCVRCLVAEEIALAVIEHVCGMDDTVEHECVHLDIQGPFRDALHHAALRPNSQTSLPGMLRNFQVSDLSEVNGARAHAMEKEAYDSVRPGKLINGRWVLNPRPTIFRPTNPDYKDIVAMGPL